VKLRGARTKKVFNNQSSDFRAKAGRRASRPPNTDSPGTEDWSIADLLEATVDDTLEFLMSFTHLPAGRRALARLKLLQDVGLGYLRLGQPINTLSGGESQRLKLVSHLAESAAASKTTATDIGRLSSRNTREEVKKWLAERNAAASGLKTCSDARSLTGSPDDKNERLLTSSAARGTLFLFDEPTTGLHFDDVRVLLQVFQRLVDAGHSVLVIEHNLDVIKCADWVIDLGPEAGEHGGQLVACGTPEDVAAAESSHTGRFLCEVLSAPGDLSIAAGTSCSGMVTNDGVSPDIASGRISVRPCRTLPSE
jgi:excinuclease ABC subunit A